MKKITSHKVNGLNDTLEIEVLDKSGDGGANHEYLIRDFNKVKCPISFQNGPIQEVGVNGISNESLLAIVEHRLQGFQSGSFTCRENAIALTKIQEAMHWLHHRTRDRVNRNVEGTHNA